MSQILFEVTCNGTVTRLEEKINGTKIDDLTVSLKTIKDSSNEALTKLLLQQGDKKECQATEEDATATDDNDEEKEEPHKRLKT